MGAIGTGRISRDHDVPGILETRPGRIVAVCDLDQKRADSKQPIASNITAKE